MACFGLMFGGIKSGGSGGRGSLVKQGGRLGAAKPRKGMFVWVYFCPQSGDVRSINTIEDLKTTVLFSGQESV